jgi:tripartite-type tricarboxylate transporter receptor subunit TctC
MFTRLVLIILGLYAAALSSPAWSQAYPAKPVRLIVPFAPGSATDIAARLIAEELRASMGQSFIVENKPGGSGQIAAEFAAKAPADGYTLLFTTNTTHSANPFLFKKLRYDPVKDFAPVARIMYIPVVLVVDPKLPINRLADLIAQAKANPGKLSFGYGNSIGQVVGASVAHTAKLDVVTVPYKSTPQAMTDVMGGQVAYTVADMASGNAYIKSGKLRAVAVSSAKRSSLMPEVPAIAETPGFEGFDLSAWLAIFAPAGTPKDVIHALNAETNKALAKPAIKERIVQFFAELAPSSPEELGEFVKQQLGSWGTRIKEAGIEPE